MRSRSRSLVFAVGVLIPITSYAVPVKFPKCADQVRVTHVAGGNGAILNENCTALYVLPPLRGSLTISGYRVGAELATKCGRLKTIEKDISDFEEISYSETRRLKRLTEQRDEIEENLRVGLIPVGETVESLDAKMEKLMDSMDKSRERIIKYQKQSNDKKIDFAKEPAGRGQFLMESSMPEILKGYSDANPSLRVTEMPIDQAFLSVNEIKLDEALASSMPWILSLRAIGIGNMPMLRDPNLLLQYKDLAPGAAPDGSKIFGGALSGELVVGNLGACAVLSHLGSRTSFSAGDMKPYVGASVAYGYQVQVTRKHRLSYNFKELVRQLHEQTKRGGLFNSSTLNSFIDQRSTGTWIDFKVSSEDTRYEYTDAYVREVKKEFIDRAIAQIVALQTGSPAAMLSLIEPGKNGAGTIGDELGKCPHLYCQIGSAGMKMLNSIFGSATAVAELTRTVSGEMVETVTEKKMVPVYGTYVFQ